MFEESLRLSSEVLLNEVVVFTKVLCHLGWHIRSPDTSSIKGAFYAVTVVAIVICCCPCQSPAEERMCIPLSLLLRLLLLGSLLDAINKGLDRG